MSINKFGQKVVLSIYDENSKLIFSSGGLRVDFDVRIVPDYNRAKFTIYNLNSKSVKDITNGERFVRLHVQLHDRKAQELAYDFYINNALTIKQVPNSLTEIYCIGTTRRDFTSKVVNVSIKNPTLKRYCEALATKAGKSINFLYEGFPVDLLNITPLNKTAVWSGSVGEALRKLGLAYSFTVNELPNSTILLQYLPQERNENSTTISSKIPYVLDTNHMRSNPRVGIEKLEIESNLDFNIKAGTILDTTKLVTVGTVRDFKHLTTVQGQIKAANSGGTKFITTTVQHKGSNYTGDWSTTAMAIKAIAGTKTNDCIEGE